MPPRHPGPEAEGPDNRAHFPLGLAPIGSWLRVEALVGGRGLVARLTAMGLYVGARVRVLNAGRPGPMVLNFGGTRLALGQGMAMQVLVSESGTDKDESTSQGIRQSPSDA